MKKRQQLRTFGYIFFALIIGLIARKVVAGNDLARFCEFHPVLSTLPDQPQVHIIEATYGDKASGTTCIPNLSICKGTSECELTVNDSLCDTDAAVKSLEVVWDCGDGTDFETSRAVKGTKITLKCGN
jgi:hypothetical protein